MPSHHPSFLPRRCAAASLAIAVGALSVAACGDADKPAAVPAAKPVAAKTGTPPARPSGDQTAEDVARAARGDLKCPPAPATPRAAGEPVDDIVGVRPGMAYDDAARHVMCSHPLLVVAVDNTNPFRLQTHGQPVRQGFRATFAKERVQKSGKEFLKEMQDSAIARGSNRAVRAVEPGQSRWYVGTMGMPGEERVTHVKREEWFAEDALPPIEKVEQALVAKYGPPTSRSAGADGLHLRWARDRNGRPGSPPGASCDVLPYLTAGVSLSPECGLVVAAFVQPLRANPGLAQALLVAVVDQARGFALIEQTDQRLQKLEAERRAKQVQDAGKSAKGPTL